MEGMRDIARSYYARASEADKRTIIQFFTELDIDGDGLISLAEFKRPISGAEAVFYKLDANGDGRLDFDEFLCLYYMSGKMPVLNCDGCAQFLVGPYFSCLLCIGRGDNSYDLCCSCYCRGAEFSHEHSVEHMVDHHSQLMLFRTRTACDEKAQNKVPITNNVSFC